MNDLFDSNIKKISPLAERMRPVILDEYVGQENLVGEKAVLRQAIINDQVPSMIFWGPPGSGKTTLARIIAQMTKSVFVPFSAISSGVKDLRQVMAQAKERAKLHSHRTILFIDEVHRWNKAQQDYLLPGVEDGTIILIGATTENPSFEINSALLSRCRVFVLESLTVENIVLLLKRVISDQNRGLKSVFNEKIKFDIPDDVLKYLAIVASGDARIAYNAIELGAKSAQIKNSTVKITKEDIEKALQKTHLLYDRAGDQHYNIISALHKSMRGGNADAALYWLGRMLEAGEDPLYIARRLIRFASEDIGIANSQALVQAVAAYQACHFIGMPECNVNLAQAVVYMAKSQKSNELYSAYLQVQKDIKDFPNEGVPLHLRNAPTKLMKDLNYGKDYKYSPDFDYNEKQEYLPESLKGGKYLKS
ncbi:MAG: replication-associated recombination protein A [bacterium]